MNVSCKGWLGTNTLAYSGEPGPSTELAKITNQNVVVRSEKPLNVVSI